jgi:hypothetical protein
MCGRKSTDMAVTPGSPPKREIPGSKRWTFCLNQRQGVPDILSAYQVIASQRALRMGRHHPSCQAALGGHRAAAVPYGIDFVHDRVQAVCPDRACSDHPPLQD